jgi:hypothetical protein
MRRLLACVFVIMVAVTAPAAPAVGEDSGSISRDAKGPQPAREHDPLGGPVTPRLYLLGQTTIFVAGVTLLVIAAALGAYTLMLARQSVPRRDPHTSH